MADDEGTGARPVVEVEIREDLQLDAETRAALDMHSFLNIMNVLVSELILLGVLCDDDDAFAPASERAYQLADAFSHPDRALPFAQAIDEHLAFLSTTIEAALGQYPELSDHPDVLEARANMTSIFDVLRVRSEEVLVRHDLGDRWETCRVDALCDQYVSFLAAVERNSKGRYGIVYDVADQEPYDYLVHVEIGSVDGATITVPPLLKDVMRDLIANARKYTAPGGCIDASLVDDGTELRLVVEDSGCGIPPDEIERVVEFGYRAENVRDQQTRGGGFGLTKAYAVAQQHNGRLWIRSQLGAGTTVTLTMPRRARPDAVAAASTVEPSPLAYA